MKTYNVSVERIFIHCLTIEAETEQEAGQKAAEKIRAEFDHDGVSVMYAEDIEAAAESEKDLMLVLNGWRLEG